MKNVSTLEAPKSIGKGQTTLQADFAVQQVFAGNKVFCQDHSDSGHGKKPNKDLIGVILNRLDSEHGLSPKKGLVVSKKEGTIQLG